MSRFHFSVDQLETLFEVAELPRLPWSPTYNLAGERLRDGECGLESLERAGVLLPGNHGGWRLNALAGLALTALACPEVLVEVGAFERVFLCGMNNGFVVATEDERQEWDITFPIANEEMLTIVNELLETDGLQSELVGFRAELFPEDLDLISQMTLGEKSSGDQIDSLKRLERLGIVAGKAELTFADKAASVFQAPLEYCLMIRRVEPYKDQLRVLEMHVYRSGKSLITVEPRRTARGRKIVVADGNSQSLSMQVCAMLLGESKLNSLYAEVNERSNG